MYINSPSPNRRYYTGALIKSAGVRDNRTTIWLSCVTSFVNFAGNLPPFFIVERWGRRRVLLGSMLAVTVALAALGTAFLVLNRDTAHSVEYDEMERKLGVRLPYEDAEDSDRKLEKHCARLRWAIFLAIFANF